MHRLLLITDDPKHWKELRSHLHGRGFAVSQAAPASVVADGAIAERFDAALLDCVGVPAAGAARLCRSLKELRGSVPVVGLLPAEQVAGLDCAIGLDDFVTVGAAPAEIETRLRLLLWRLHRVDSASGIRLGALVIDVAKYEVTLDRQPVELTFKEYELLRFLATHAGQVFTRQALLDKVWGYEYYGGTRTVDVHIRRLRSKLEQNGHTFIDTVRNVGYKFIAPSGESS
jgi:DNA-binding response OmpR family regulator